MADYLYVVNDLVFENEEGKHNAKSRALNYCKKNGINTNLVMQIASEVDLAYYQLLREKKSRGEISGLELNMYFTIVQSFYNANREFIPAMMTIVPFVFTDKEGKRHYQKVVGNIKDLDGKLVDTKYMFDLHHVVQKKYLELIYLDENGSFKTWTIDEIENLRKLYRAKKHKETLAKLRQLRERQKYDRLKRLRAEGKITDNQRKELYRLEELYERG